MLVDKQNELMSDLLFTVHQHGGDDVTWKPPIGFTCPATIHFKFMTKCDDYNKVQQNMRDVVIWIHTIYIFHFLADFCLDVKAERGNVWGPFIILVMVGWVQPHPNGVMLNLSLYFKSFVRWETGRGEKLLFFIWTTNFSVFFFSVVAVVF